MYEIELKAHVRDKEALEEKLKKNAIYRGFREKKDTYWKLTKKTPKPKRGKLRKFSLHIREKKYGQQKMGQP